MKASASPYRFSWFDWFCLWYPPGWLILFNRHWQHYKPDPDGWIGLEYGLFLIPGGFYLALLIRWLRLGCRSPQTETPPPDPEYQKAFRDEILAVIVKHYFRGELFQTENLPQNGPAIVILNHAGMCFPWDFLGLGVLLGQVRRDWFVQPLAHVAIFEHPWVIWWLPAGWAQVLGGVRAEREALEAAIAHQTLLLYAPEGARGPGKGWPHRYQLDTFDPSFMKLSDRYQVPILPVVCLGNEDLHPWAFNLKRLGRRIGLPFLPVSLLMIVFILFPSMGLWAARTRLRYYVQPLCRPWEQEEQVQKRSLAYQLAEKLRSQLQIAINQLRNQQK